MCSMHFVDLGVMANCGFIFTALVINYIQEHLERRVGSRTKPWFNPRFCLIGMFYPLLLSSHSRWRYTLRRLI